MSKDNSYGVGDEVLLKDGTRGVYLDGTRVVAKIFTPFGICSFQRSFIKCKTTRSFPQIPEILKQLQEGE